MADINSRRMLTCGEVAVICSVTSQAVRGWVSQKQIKAVRLTSRGHFRLTPKEVIRFLKRHGYVIPPDLRELADAWT